MNKKLKSSTEKIAKIQFPSEIILSPRDSKRFLEALSKPPKPNKKLINLTARFKNKTEENR